MVAVRKPHQWHRHYTPFTIGSLTAKASPVGADLVMIQDSVGGGLKNTTLTELIGAVASGVSSVSNSDSTLTISPTTGAVVAAVNRAFAFVWSGIHTFTANVFFHANAYFSGVPWFDVKSNANSCAAAVGNGSTDDTAAIQCHINFMSTTYGGGFVFVSPAPSGYLVSGGGVTVPAGVYLVGAGIGASILQVTTNSAVVSFSISGGTCPTGNHNGGMRDIQINGFNNSGATTPAVSIGANCNVFIRDSRLMFGQYGLQNNGVDSYIENCFIWGYTAALISSGANWYIRDKFDQPGATAAQFGYIQNPPIAGLSPAENHFTQSDFTGGYIDSVIIQDGSGSNAITHFDGSVFSSPISITGAKVTMFGGAEFGGNITNSSGFLNIVGSYGFTGITASGAGARSCAGNANITC
jgi:hypothetical protein